MLNWITNINHLAYVDRNIIFAYTSGYSSVKIMSILKKYDIQSGQKIKKDKRAFFIHQNQAPARTLLVQECTSFYTRRFQLNYLGCPISHKRNRKENYSDLITRVKSELQSWTENMLSYGGNEILINSVLQCVLILVLSARLLGMIFAFPKKRVVFLLGLYLIYLKIDMLNSIGVSESKLFMGK